MGTERSATSSDENGRQQQLLPRSELGFGPSGLTPNRSHHQVLCDSQKINRRRGDDSDSHSWDAGSVLSLRPEKRQTEHPLREDPYRRRFRWHDGCADVSTFNCEVRRRRRGVDVAIEYRVASRGPEGRSKEDLVDCCEYGCRRGRDRLECPAMQGASQPPTAKAPYVRGVHVAAIVIVGASGDVPDEPRGSGDRSTPCESRGSEQMGGCDRW